MRLSQKTLISFSAALLACAGAQAVTPRSSPNSSSNRYDVIPERNMFGLRPQVAPTATPLPEPPLSKVVLKGITTISEPKKAILNVLPQATKPGQPAKEEAFILGENQREGEIEV